ncbi:MAG: hypothetical protein O7G85_01265 [Planctomycetota bacterium]|nr:hypothetical protein [Planctomycetota bacterium]
MQFAAKKKPLILGTSALFICLAMYFGLIRNGSAQDELRLIDDPVSLSHEKDIRDASIILIKIALSSDDTSSEVREKLKAMMLKLRDGWEGFVPRDAGNASIEASPEDVLAHFYWEIAWHIKQDDWDIGRRVTKNDVASEKAMVRLLDEMRPEPNTFLWDSYEYALQRHDLEHLLLEED